MPGNIITIIIWPIIIIEGIISLKDIGDLVVV